MVRIKVRGGEAYGFQTVSNFMRAGDYDNTFMNKYGDALVATEKKMKLPDHYLQGTGVQVPKLNFLGDDDFGRDPMTRGQPRPRPEPLHPHPGHQRRRLRRQRPSTRTFRRPVIPTDPAPAQTPPNTSAMASVRGRRIRTAAAALATVGTLLLTAGCGGGGRDYTLPKNVCGTRIDPGLLSDFMPDGETVKAQPTGQSIWYCKVFVDKAQVFRTQDAVTTVDTDPLKVKERELTREGNPVRVPGPGEKGVVTDMGAMAVSRCSVKGKQHVFVSEIDLFAERPDNTADRRKALKAFMKAYHPRAMAHHGCTAT
ncbi:hypothetical protein [Streptomyces sp. NPDC050264]|uniref:hypothetical protein n=1 Tax=Streptomyces sp. NPDC050264 TaxID=3155038 RepID=UPI003435785D